MKHIILTIITILSFVCTNGQSNNKKIERSVMIVHSDFTSFSMSNEYLFDSILSDYEVKEVESEGFLETEFYSVKPICISCTDCYYLLGLYNNRFFKLKGFKQNEFTEFFNLVIMREFPSLSSKSPKKALKKMRSMPISVNDFDIEKAFYNYYENYKASMFDKSSCYRGMQIQDY